MLAELFNRWGSSAAQYSSGMMEVMRKNASHTRMTLPVNSLCLPPPSPPPSLSLSLPPPPTLSLHLDIPPFLLPPSLPAPPYRVTLLRATVPAHIIL